MLLFTLLSMLWKYVTVLSFLITVFFPLAAALLSVLLFFCQNFTVSWLELTLSYRPVPAQSCVCLTLVAPK